MDNIIIFNCKHLLQYAQSIIDINIPHPYSLKDLIKSLCDDGIPIHKTASVDKVAYTLLNLVCDNLDNIQVYTPYISKEYLIQSINKASQLYNISEEDAIIYTCLQEVNTLNH